jgi:hypothetical protein|tara:strand:- start:122 stop:304 length:183 start_codon:yes stop_codon:yes gene_type:complete
MRPKKKLTAVKSSFTSVKSFVLSEGKLNNSEEHVFHTHLDVHELLTTNTTTGRANTIKVT